jgi:hypothetical protein
MGDSYRNLDKIHFKLNNDALYILFLVIFFSVMRDFKTL